MSIINKELPTFKVEAYHEGKFKTISTSDVKGKWSVFFFYPADFTFVCPTELEDMADHYEKLKKMNVEIYAVSTDSHFVHKAWHDTSESIKKVKFPMLGDTTGAITRGFNIMIEESGLALRGTFVANPDGIVKIAEIHDLGIGRSAVELVRKVQAAQYVETNSGEVCPAKWHPGDKTLKPSVDAVGKI